MVDRAVITGAPRSGTKHLATLLTAAGVPAGHEKAHNARRRGDWPSGLAVDSSWMAATMLDCVAAPVVLLVRHPLRVVKSLVEIGFFGDIDAKNPTHGPLRRFAPAVYKHPTVPDRALAAWLVLTRAALTRAEMVIRHHQLDSAVLARLVAWCGGNPDRAEHAWQQVGVVNRHERMRARVAVTHTGGWGAHDRQLAARARRLARLLGYHPDQP